MSRKSKSGTRRTLYPGKVRRRGLRNPGSTTVDEQHNDKINWI